MKLPHERLGYAWLIASLGSRTMMEYYCTGGVLQYASGHLTPIELLHVHRVREGERVAKASTYCSCLCVHDRWANRSAAHLSCSQRQVRLRREGVVVIKLLGLV